MKEVLSENLRNVAVVGHGQTGKTSLVSAILFDTKMVNRLGKVEAGNTVTDYEDEEIARKISIQSSVAYAFRDKNKINLLDTPGFGNFVWEAKVSLRAVETALLLVSAQEGVQVQTERMADAAAELNRSLVIVVNKMGKELADFDTVLDGLTETLGKNVMPVQIPIGKGPAFNGLVDLLTMKAFQFTADEKGEGKEIPIPADLESEAKSRREMLIEKIAEADEALMEKFFEQGDLSEEEITLGLKKGIAERGIFPVLVCDALTNMGVNPLIDFIVRFGPSPLDFPEVPTVDGKLTAKREAPFAGQVFKTISDPFTGKVSLIRVCAGVFKPDTFYYNPNKDVEERVAGLFALLGKTQESMGEAPVGDIVAVTKLKETQTGHTLTMKGEKVRFPDITFPIPSISFAIEPKARTDEGKISVALQRIMEEDPTVRMNRDPQTKETIISGNGQLHVELVVNKLKKKYGVEVDMKPPKIAYRETIQGKADIEKKYKKQTGGRGQYAHVFIRMNALPRGTDYQFENSLVGMSIPRNFVPAIEKGIQEARLSGVVAGYPVVDFRVELYDGSHHEVDSSDMAFKMCSSMAFKMAMKQAKPVLLEPIVKVEVVIPADNMGEINGYLSGRRGRIQGMETKGKYHVIKALCPMVEMLDFEPTLTSITGGRGSYAMEPSHYEEVPAQLQKKIVEEAVREGRIKEEEE